MLRRVEFIGRGYEVVKFIMVDTPTMGEALDAAKKWYKDSGQDFHYCEMEIPKEYAYNEPLKNSGRVNEQLASARQQSVNKHFPVVKFNDAGQEIYREEENGYWVKREYDEQGRQVYWETNRGGWAKHQYDDAGNETFYENSDGFWYKAEFSDSGFRTYYEDSNGKVLGSKGVDALVNDASERSKVSEESVDKTVVEKEL